MKSIPHKIGLFSHAVYQNNTELACYILNIYQPVVIIFLQEIAMLFEVSYAYLICYVRLLLRP